MRCLMNWLDLKIKQMIQITIENWKQLNEILDAQFSQSIKSSAYRYNYRGQCDKKWKLDTSIARIVNGNEISENKAKFYERQSMLEFKAIHHLKEDKLVFSEEMSNEALLIDMQHFSCPTRLLDWSTSPYVALYFAINSNFESDGALFVWDYQDFFKSVSEIHKKFIDLQFPELMDFNEFDHVQIAIPIIKNERSYRQQGIFSVSNNILKSHCEIIDEVHSERNETSSLTKYIIPCKLKVEFLQRLRNMNITASSLFSGLDGFGREIKESLLLRKWTGN